MGSILRKRRLASALLALALLQHGATASASDGLNSPALRFSGFATVGAVKGGDDNLGFRRDLARTGVFDGDADWAMDSLLGLQLDLRLTEKLDGAVQMVIRDRLDDALENQVEWAFLRYRFSPDWTLRVGRIGLDVYALSEYRNVGFSYLWVRPPVEFYAPVPFYSFDGLDLTWSRPLGDGMFRAKLYGGRTGNDFEVGDGVTGHTLEPIIGVTLGWESDHWQLRMTMSQTEVEEEQEYFPGLQPLADALEQVVLLWPEATNLQANLKAGGSKIYYHSIGAAYTNAPWQVQAEVGFIDSQLDVYPALLNSYVSIGRQFGAVTVYGMLADSDNQNERVEVEPPFIPFLPVESAQLAFLGQTLQTAFDNASMDQSSLSLGMRWDVRYDTALKVQWDRSWVSAYGSGIWDTKVAPEDDQILDTFTINLNVIF